MSSFHQGLTAPGAFWSQHWALPQLPASHQPLEGGASVGKWASGTPGCKTGLKATLGQKHQSPALGGYWGHEGAE